MGTGVVEGDDASEEDDVFAIEFHTRGIDLEIVWISHKALVEGFQRVHSAMFEA